MHDNDDDLDLTLAETLAEEAYVFGGWLGIGFMVFAIGFLLMHLLG
jgi:hypothetical protein